MRRRFQNKTFDEINITPLMDTVFFLLIIFMITAPLLEYSIDVSPPKMEAAEIKVDDFTKVVHVNKAKIIQYRQFRYKNRRIDFFRNGKKYHGKNQHRGMEQRNGAENQSSFAGLHIGQRGFPRYPLYARHQSAVPIPAYTPDGVPDKGEPDPDLPPIEQFEPIKDLPKLPDPPKEQKAEPQPQPPAPAPQPQPKETAKPEKRPVEKVPETVKQTPVENGKGKTPAKTDSKPKKKYLSADDIKISRKVVHRNTSRKNTGRSAAESANARAEAARNARNAALAQRLRNLSQYGVAGGQGTPGGGGGRNGVVSKEINDYYNKIEAFLKRRWNQPRLAQKTANLKAVVAIQVDARGRILSARIIQSSGVSAMDASVRELLASLSTLPVPPKAMAFTVDMEIDR